MVDTYTTIGGAVLEDIDLQSKCPETEEICPIEQHELSRCVLLGGDTACGGLVEVTLTKTKGVHDA